MIFWLFVIIAILGATIYFIGKNHWGDNYSKYSEDSFWRKAKHKFYYSDETISAIGTLIFWISFVIVIAMTIGLVYTYSTVPGDIAECQERYEALTYKMESTTCRDEFGFLSKDIIDEVQSWNENLTYNKAMQRNFWIGIFVPNIYDQFELIEYNTYVLLGGG